MQGLGDGPREREDLERLGPLHSLRGPGARVGEKKLVKALTAAARAELLPAIPREDAVRDVRAHLDRTQPREQLLALDQGTPRLHQVVDDDDVAPRRFTLLELHQPLVSLPHLGAHNLLHPFEEGVEPFPRTLVGVGDNDVIRVLALGQAVQ